MERLPQQREAVEEFRRQHRTAVVAFLFTDIDHSSPLLSRMGEVAATARIRRHDKAARKIMIYLVRCRFHLTFAVLCFVSLPVSFPHMETAGGKCTRVAGGV